MENGTVSQIELEVPESYTHFLLLLSVCGESLHSGLHRATEIVSPVYPGVNTTMCTAPRVVCYGHAYTPSAPHGAVCGKLE